MPLEVGYVRGPANLIVVRALFGRHVSDKSLFRTVHELRNCINPRVGIKELFGSKPGKTFNGRLGAPVNQPQMKSETIERVNETFELHYRDNNKLHVFVKDAEEQRQY